MTITPKIIEHAAFYRSNIENIVLPDKVALIDGYCFSYCPKLRTVDIGRGIRSIDSYAFNENIALESVTIRSEEPPSIDPHTFFGMPDNVVLRVPASALEKYRNHPDWQVFKKIEAIRN